MGGVTGEVHLLISPTGGRGRAAAAAPMVRRVIEECGYEPVDVSAAGAEATADAARAAVAAGAQRLISVGGDGTLHLAVQGVAGTDAALGVVPVGTGNDFARAFGLFGLSVEDATRRALGPTRPVDAISTDRGRWIAFNVTGGFSVDVNVTADQMRFPKGPSRYTVATLTTIPRLRHRHLAVTVSGQRNEFRSALFAVANTPTFGGGMAICPDADAADGILDVAVLGPAGRATLLRLLPKVFKGAHVGHRHVHMLRGPSVTIESLADPVDLVGDGEPVGTTPITLEAVPGAINLAAD